jgi:hypothetical protein
MKVRNRRVPPGTQFIDTIKPLPYGIPWSRLVGAGRAWLAALLRFYRHF